MKIARKRRKKRRASHARQRDCVCVGCLFVFVNCLQKGEQFFFFHFLFYYLKENHKTGDLVLSALFQHGQCLGLADEDFCASKGHVLNKNTKFKTHSKCKMAFFFLVVKKLQTHVSGRICACLKTEKYLQHKDKVCMFKNYTNLHKLERLGNRDGSISRVTPWKWS